MFLITLFPVMAEEEKKTDLSPMTVDDVLNLERPSQLRISPDNKRLLWVCNSPDEEDNRYISNIWMASVTNGKEPLQLTKGKHKSHSPEWSPDGKLIAFLSDRIDDKTGIFTISSSGGEAEQLFEWKKDIDGFKWKDSKTIIFLARENTYHYEQELEDKHDDGKIIDDMETFVPSRLFSYSLEDKKIKRLTDNKDQIQDFVVSPDGKWALTTHVDTPLYGLDARYFKKYYLLNLTDTSVKQIFKDPYFAPHDFAWAEDGTLYMLEDKSSYEEKQGPGMPLLYEYDIKTDTAREVPLNSPWGAGLSEGKMLDCGGSYVATTIAKGVVNPLVILSKPGSQWTLTEIEDEKSSNFETFSFGRNGKSIAFVYSTAGTPPQIYYADIEGNKFTHVTPIGEFNKNFKDIFLAKREIIKWKSDGGREIEGILYYPKNYKEGQKYPLMVQIHGGPSWYDGDTFDTSWAYYPHILAAKESFVLAVNYSGSANYGLPFMESIIGHYYELEVPDILTGIDYLTGKGMVDPEKLGTMGWSNGSLLSIALTVESNRFKVASCGAGDVNWISDYGNCAFGVQFDNLYLQGPYWEHLDHYLAKSPLLKMNKVVTPTLIIFGEHDTSVPTQQGYEHYRTLQQLGKVPVRFLLLPDEPHSLKKLSHKKRKMEEELAWFDTYLYKPEKDKKNRSFKEGSPIDIKIKKSDFLYDESGNLGIKKDDILIPETIETLQAGRFEVTRAQFSQFLKDSKNIDIKNLTGWSDKGFKSGTENYPVSGITADTAQKYCQWLSKKTGSKYRLPKPDEMESWLKKAEGDENTLDYWAGYSLSPDEALEIEEYIKKLETGEGLILPAGSFGESFDKLYDINGNVSELCSDGSVKGLSARNISDKKETFKDAGPLYTGFRVVKEK